VPGRERVALDDPALALPAQPGLGRVGQDDLASRNAGRQRVGVHDDAGADALGMIEGEPADEIAAARVPDDMDVLEPERGQEPVRVPHHRRHAVVVVLRIVGVSLAQLVDREHTVPSAQTLDVELPVARRFGQVLRPEIAAVEQDERRALAGHEVAGPDPVDIDEFRLVHCPGQARSGQSHRCRHASRPIVSDRACRLNPSISGRKTVGRPGCPQGRSPGPGGKNLSLQRKTLLS